MRPGPQPRLQLEQRLVTRNGAKIRPWHPDLVRVIDDVDERKILCFGIAVTHPLKDDKDISGPEVIRLAPHEVLPVPVHYDHQLVEVMAVRVGHRAMPGYPHRPESEGRVFKELFVPKFFH